MIPQPMTWISFLQILAEPSELRSDSLQRAARAARVFSATSSVNTSSFMRILAVHNRYQQRGGEDVVFEDETRLLEDNGCHVVRFIKTNHELHRTSNLRLTSNTIWNRAACEELAAVVRAEKADIVHCHNLFPILSPACFRAARHAGAAIVHTLHNFRVICPKGILYRNGGACFDCIEKKFAWPAIVHACYRESRSASAVTAVSSTVHRYLNTFSKHVDAYIAPTQFLKRVYAASGFPLARVHVKPHFIPQDLGAATGSERFVLYVGRLSEEKGVRTLLEAWQSLPDVSLKLIGDGELVSLMNRLPANIQYLGQLDQFSTLDWMGRAGCLIVPSDCFESFGRVIIEAYSRGTPVICSDHGGQSELVGNNLGRRFIPGNSSDLVRQVRSFYSDQQSFNQLRQRVREQYLNCYTAEDNFRQLTQIYQQALANRHQSS